MGEGKEAGMGREREGERQKRDSRPDKTIGGSQGGDMVSVCTSHTSQVLEMNSIL